MTASLILHHHDPSPFAEKIRVLFGIKTLAWQSVQVPMVMPKPDLTRLTGGYRGTPVLQIGSDIFCDTRLIALTIEERFPVPSVFLTGPLFNFGLQHWSDEAMFTPGSALALHENSKALPSAVSKDRKAYFDHLDFAAFKKDAPNFRAQFGAQGALIDRQLSDGRAFLSGDTPEWVDLNAYFNVWMADGHIPSAQTLFAEFDHLPAWHDRMKALGHGTRQEISVSDAHAIARDTAPEPVKAGAAWAEPTGLVPGDAVVVTNMHNAPMAVSGKLTAVSASEIVLHREDSDLGALAVHFPRIGYRLQRA